LAQSFRQPLADEPCRYRSHRQHRLARSDAPAAMDRPALARSAAKAAALRRGQMQKLPAGSLWRPQMASSQTLEYAECQSARKGAMSLIGTKLARKQPSMSAFRVEA
jgi:hypothetical protein